MTIKTQQSTDRILIVDDETNMRKTLAYKENL